jgi:hypothetical protein
MCRIREGGGRVVPDGINGWIVSIVHGILGIDGSIGTCI